MGRGRNRAVEKEQAHYQPGNIVANYIFQLSHHAGQFDLPHRATKYTASAVHVHCNDWSKLHLKKYPFATLEINVSVGGKGGIHPISTHT